MDMATPEMGKIWLQTMPISGVAMSIYPFLPTKGNG